MPTLALIDGHSVAYRAFYALPAELSTRSGQVTNAAYGFTSILINLLRDHRPDALAVAWDTPETTFRSEAYPEYKAQREAAPDLFRSQLPLIKEVVSVLNITQFELPGFEADDIIATLSRAAAADDWNVLIVTGDRDAFQLIDQRIQVLYTRRGISDTIVADIAYVETRYGVRPDQYPEYAALRGDSSDNLPGVPGVGEKTAGRLIRDYGSIDTLYEHLDEMTPKLRENLEASREQVFINRQLTPLRDDVAVDADPDAMRLVPWDQAMVRKVFEDLEFRSLWQRLQEEVGGSAEVGAFEVLESETVTATPADLERLAAAKAVTIEPLWEEERLAGLVVADGPDRAVFVDDPDRLGGVLASPDVPKHLHDAKPLVKALLDAGLDLDGLAFDTALAGYVINPAGEHGLADLAARFLELELVSPDREAGADEGQGTLDFAGGPDLDGAGRRAVAVDRLVGPLREALSERGATSLYEEIELPLVRVLARMELDGIGVDQEYLEELGESLRDRLATLERDIHQAAGGPFNVNSTLQLREVLFERLELPVLKKTPKGAPSTDASVLAQLAEAHPIVAQLLRFRELEKLRSTYVDGYLPLIEPDGRIRASFNQMAATTGRLSSERPNLQNIPVRSEEGRTIRRAFVARPGWQFVVADYSQIELRILAHLSADPGLLEAFSGEETDIHTATAARVFEVEPAHVTHEMRRRAKTINFGLIYGMEAYGLAQRLEISREEAAEHIAAYFAQFPKVREFMEGVVEEARHVGYTTTMFGRRRYLPQLAAGTYQRRMEGERMALNAPVQGSAADVIKMAMVALDRELEQSGGETTLVLQVHDELVLEAPPEEVEETVALTRRVMEGVAELRVPLRVDVASGANLADAKS